MRGRRAIPARIRRSSIVFATNVKWPGSVPPSQTIVWPSPRTSRTRRSPPPAGNNRGDMRGLVCEMPREMPMGQKEAKRPGWLLLVRNPSRSDGAAVGSRVAPGDERRAVDPDHLGVSDRPVHLPEGLHVEAARVRTRRGPLRAAAPSASIHGSPRSGDIPPTSQRGAATASTGSRSIEGSHERHQIDLGLSAAARSRERHEVAVPMHRDRHQRVRRSLARRELVGVPRLEREAGARSWGTIRSRARGSPAPKPL